MRYRLFITEGERSAHLAFGRISAGLDAGGFRRAQLFQGVLDPRPIDGRAFHEADARERIAQGGRFEGVEPRGPLAVEFFDAVDQVQALGRALLSDDDCLGLLVLIREWPGFRKIGDDTADGLCPASDATPLAFFEKRKELVPRERVRSQNQRHEQSVGVRITARPFIS